MIFFAYGNIHIKWLHNFILRKLFMFRFLVSFLISSIFCFATFGTGLWQSHEFLKSTLKQNLINQTFSTELLNSVKSLNALRSIFHQSILPVETFKLWDSSLRQNSVDSLTNALDQIAPTFWNSSRREDFMLRIEKESDRALQQEQIDALDEPRLLLANFLGVRETPGEAVIYSEGIFTGLPTLASFSPPPQSLVELANIITERGLTKAPIRGYKTKDVLEEFEHIRALTNEALKPFAARSKSDFKLSNTLPPDAKVLREELRSYLIEIVNKIDINFF